MDAGGAGGVDERTVRSQAAAHGGRVIGPVLTFAGDRVDCHDYV